MIYCAMPYAIEGLLKTEKTLKKDELGGVTVFKSEKDMNMISSRVEAVLLDNGERLAAGMVVFAVGMKPNVELFENSGLEMVKDGIVVDGAMRTNIKDVYAVGDCVSYAEFTTAFPIMPTAKKVRLKVIADRDTGRILGGQVVSGEPVTDKVDQITMAIQFGITAPQLLGFSYSSQPWQSFFPAHNLLVKAAEKIVAELEPARRSAVKAG